MEERKEQDARQRADASEREGECERAKMMEATQAHLIITPAHMSRRIHVCHMRRRIYVCHMRRRIHVCHNHFSTHTYRHTHTSARGDSGTVKREKQIPVRYLQELYNTPLQHTFTTQRATQLYNTTLQQKLTTQKIPMRYMPDHPSKVKAHAQQWRLRPPPLFLPYELPAQICICMYT